MQNVEDMNEKPFIVNDCNDHDLDRLTAVGPFTLPTLPLVFRTPFFTSLLSALFRTGLPLIFATPNIPLPLLLFVLAGVFGLDGLSAAGSSCCVQFSTSDVSSCSASSSPVVLYRVLVVVVVVV